MTSIHLDKYMVRTLRGHYVKTDDGVGYVMFHAKSKAKEWVENQGLIDCYVVKVRIAITPSNSGRAERLVAVRETRPQAIPQAQQEFIF